MFKTLVQLRSCQTFADRQGSSTVTSSTGNWELFFTGCFATTIFPFSSKWRSGPSVFPAGLLLLVTINTPVKRDASFYPLYTHTPLLCLIFHCLQLEVSLIYGLFLCSMDHYRCSDELPGIYLASIDFLKSFKTISLWCFLFPQWLLPSLPS